MEAPYQAPLTPKQLAAIYASGGFAHCEDPSTHVLYQLIKFESPTVDDDYLRQKIEEAYAADAEIGFKPFNMGAIRSEVHRRLAMKLKPRC